MSDCWLRVLMRGLLHFLEIYLASGRCLSSPVSTWKACFLRNLLRGFQCLSLAFHPLTTLLAPKQNTQSLLNYSCSIPEKYYFIESLKITECIVAGTSPNTDTARESGEGSQLPPLRQQRGVSRSLLDVQAALSLSRSWLSPRDAMPSIHEVSNHVVNPVNRLTILRGRTFRLCVFSHLKCLDDLIVWH